MPGGGAPPECSAEFTIGAPGRGSPGDEVDRLDCGAGYRLSREALLKASWQRTRLHAADGRQTFDLFATQLSLEF